VADSAVLLQLFEERVAGHNVDSKGFVGATTALLAADLLAMATRAGRLPQLVVFLESSPGDALSSQRTDRTRVDNGQLHPRCDVDTPWQESDDSVTNNEASEEHDDGAEDGDE
jgi:hypothetical protein